MEISFVLIVRQILNFLVLLGDDLSCISIFIIHGTGCLAPIGLKCFLAVQIKMISPAAEHFLITIHEILTAGNIR